MTVTRCRLFSDYGCIKPEVRDRGKLPRRAERGIQSFRVMNRIIRRVLFHLFPSLANYFSVPVIEPITNIVLDIAFALLAVLFSIYARHDRVSILHAVASVIYSLTSL